MNDLRMVLRRHGWFFLPILVLALVVAVAGRVGSGQMVAQMHALGVRSVIVCARLLGAACGPLQ